MCLLSLKPCLSLEHTHTLQTGTTWKSSWCQTTGQHDKKQNKHNLHNLVGLTVQLFCFMQSSHFRNHVGRIVSVDATSCSSQSMAVPPPCLHFSQGNKLVGKQKEKQLKHWLQQHEFTGGWRGRTASSSVGIKGAVRTRSGYMFALPEFTQDYEGETTVLPKKKKSHTNVVSRVFFNLNRELFLDPRMIST